MLHLCVNSGLVLIMLWSECSFIRHTNEIVILKTQICVFPLPSPRMRWGPVISALIQDSVGQWLEFQTQHAVTVGGGGTELWGGWEPGRES